MRRSLSMMPGTYFISHAYRDQSSLQQLLANLPEGVSPHIFPPIQVSPTEFVSNPLLEAILQSDGLIVLQGGYSDTSFWVAFERDYALRADKPVFSFDPPSLRFERLVLDPNASPVLPLALHGFADSTEESNQISNIINFMTKERFFDPSAEVCGWQGAIERLKHGGYLLVFASGGTREKYYRDLPTRYGSDRVMLVLMKECSVPDTFDPNLVIRLYDEHLGKRVNNKRVDDVVVRLYWMIYQNTHQEH